MWRPDLDHVGIDVKPVVIRYATRRGNQRGLKNVRFAVIDAERLLRDVRIDSTAALSYLIVSGMLVILSMILLARRFGSE